MNLILGNEGNGMRPETEKLLHKSVRFRDLENRSLQKV
jgi:tRNA G18 (ribose-2'-O)-methylase SpoU